MYYPLKEQKNAYLITCSFYRQEIWALTWEDVLSFMEKNVGFDYGIQKVPVSEMKEGAAIILGIKDKKERGDYSIEEFGGWLETVIEKANWEKKLEKLYNEVKISYPEWAERWYKNILKSVDEVTTTWNDKDRTDYIGCLEIDWVNGKVWQMVAGSFHWDETPEGSKYWSSIYERVYDKYEKSCLRGR